MQNVCTIIYYHKYLGQSRGRDETPLPLKKYENRHLVSKNNLMTILLIYVRSILELNLQIINFFFFLSK